MDINNTSQLVSTVGFPIAMCLILVYVIYKMSTSHKQEMDSLKDALNQNTLVIQKLSDKLDNLFYEKKDEET